MFGRGTTDGGTVNLQNLHTVYERATQFEVSMEELNEDAGKNEKRNDVPTGPNGQQAIEDAFRKMTAHSQRVFLELIHQQGSGGPANVADYVFQHCRTQFKVWLKKGGVLR